MKTLFTSLALVFAFSASQSFAYDDYEDETGYCTSPCYLDSMERCTCPKTNSSGVRG